MRVVLLLHLLVIFLSGLNGYKILVYSPKFAYAHTKFMGVLADTLVDAGHDVTLLVSEVDVLVNTNGSSKANLVYVAAHPKTMENMKRQHEDEFCRTMWTMAARSPSLIVALRNAMAEILLPQCEHLLNQSDILTSLQREKFDVGITETMDSCGIGLFHALGIQSTISGSSLYLLERTQFAIGQPSNPSYVPGSMSPVSDTMTFYNRMENIASIFYTNSLLYHIEILEEKLFKTKFGQDFPSLFSLIGETTYSFTNSLPYFDYPRPVLPRIMDLGGITLAGPKPLNQNLLDIIAKRSSVILVSFGSIAKSSQMPAAYKANLVKAMKQFPDILFLWKHEHPQDEMVTLVENIITSSWVPQNDILAHEKTIGFITHGGLNSVTEAVLMGKPMLVVPMFADQLRSALLVEKRGLGLTISKENLGEYQIVYDNIEKLIHEQKLKDACNRFVRLQKANGHNPRQLFVKNVELLGEFRDLPELDQMSRHMDLVALYSIDMALLFIIPLMALFAFILWIVIRADNKKRAEMRKQKLKRN